MEKIVIIDDSPVIGERLKSILGEAGYQVYIETNGKDGIELIRNISPDLLITEILLPEMDGFEIVSEVKSFLPDLKIIAMTAGGFISAGQYLLAMKAFGVEFTLKKPFRDAYFRSVVKSLLMKEKFINDHVN